MDGYDIIGDVHGCAFKLFERLTSLGYFLDPITEAFRHDERQAIFVGDLIDRGPSQVEVLRTVKAMVDEGAAQIVMGNHELNALAFSLPDPHAKGSFVRKHTEKNLLQHEAFLTQLNSFEKSFYLDWFRTIPLWLDLGPIRVVHACWHQGSIGEVVKKLGGNQFRDDSQIIEATHESGENSPDSLFTLVETLLKGPELPLRAYDAPVFVDKDEHKRGHARIRWWRLEGDQAIDWAEIPGGAKDKDGEDWMEAHGSLLEVPVRRRDQSYSYRGETPVFYGHYWRVEDAPDHDNWTERTACVDFSAVKGGQLVAYRWSGESVLTGANYEPVRVGTKASQD